MDESVENWDKRAVEKTGGGAAGGMHVGNSTYTMVDTDVQGLVELATERKEIAASPKNCKRIRIEGSQIMGYQQGYYHTFPTCACME